MSRTERTVLTNMSMIYDGDKILVQNRIDPNWPGIVFPGELRASSEGEVFWINRKDLSNYTLAEGFEEMLEVFEKDDLSENYHWIENGDDWHCENL